MVKRIFSAFVLVLLLAQSGWAIELHDAKAQGLVGEGNTGYLAAVKTPASNEVQALLSDVNAKRKAKFEGTAKSTGTTLEQVANRFYELAIQKTAAGHYYQERDGTWKQK